MPPRFCPRCGTQAAPGAKYCGECGADLRGAAAGPPGAGGWRFTSAGAAVLGGFLLAGLAIWAAILSPPPPRPAPGACRPSGAASAAAPGMPPDHPKIELPEEARRMLADLGRTARDSPQDVEAWIRAGQAHQRAAQFDPGLRAEALGFFTHALDLAPKHPDALRGKADLLYDQERFAEAIAAYDAYLVERPDDLSARTDLATMHFYGGDVPRAMAIYRDVLARNPSFVQAHMNLGIALYRQGDGAGALSEFETARSLAGDDQLRRQIDGMIASIRGAPPPSTGAPPDRTAFQAAVEQALRSQQIVGAKITRFEWSVAAGRVILHDFPMDAMPAAVREKFLARLRDTLRDAARTNGITEPPRLEIADAGSGVVMATVSP